MKILPSFRLVRPAVSLSGVVVVTLSGVLAGCNSQPRGPRPPSVVYSEPAPGPVVIVEAPPPPRREVRVRQPGPDVVYVKGYWVHRGHGYEWVPGHWERPPQARARWVEPRWERRGNGYIFIEGRWSN